MKKLFIAILFMCVAVFTFSETVVEMDGYDWRSFSEEQKNYITAGAMLGSMMNIEITNSLYDSGETSGTALKIITNLNDMRIQISYLVSKVDEWYNDTREWETEIYYVIYGSIGNLDSFVEYIEELETENDSLEEL